MLICYYSTKTKKTEKFVKKLDIKSVSITNDDNNIILINEPAVLVFPTYAIQGKILPPLVSKFLNEKQNRDNIVAIIGTGDINFAQHYCYAAIIAAKKLNVPLLHKVDLEGTPQDVLEVNEKLKKIIIQTTK